MKLSGFILSLVFSVNAYGIDVFFNLDTQLSSVDCQKFEVVVVGVPSVTYSIEKAGDGEGAVSPARICKSLENFSKANKKITLLTAAKEKMGDYLSKPIAVGFVDKDSRRETLGLDESNDVVQEMCGNPSRRVQICVWSARDGAKFIAIQVFNAASRIYSTTIDSEGNMLAVDKSDGEVLYRLSIKTDPVDQAILGDLQTDGSRHFPPFKMHKQK